MPDMDSVWSNAEYTRALAHLDTLQQQINDLRASLPLIVTPLATLTSPNHGWTSSPSYLYTTFATNALQAADDVRQAQGAWATDYTKQILSKVEESVVQDGDVQVRNWALVDSHSPFDMKVEDTGDNRLGGDDDGQIKQEFEHEVETQEEDIEGIVSSFAQLDLEIEHQKSGLIKVSTKLQDRLDYLRFTVKKVVQGDKDEWYFRAMVVLGMAPQVRESITRCLESRPGKRDLQATLKILAGYRDIHVTPCGNCGKRIGPGAMLPTARRIDSRLDNVVRAFHEQCLGVSP